MNILSSPSLNSATNALRILANGAAAKVAGAYGAKVGPSGPAPSTSPTAAGPKIPTYAQRWVSAYDTATRITFSLAAAEKAYGADSFLMQTVRGRADQVEIIQSTVPADKAAFKKDVLTFLAESMKTLPDFMAALKAGKVVVHTVDEVPEFNFSPTVSFNMLNNGMSGAGSGSFTPPGANLALYDKLEVTRGQSVGALGNHQFYAYFLRDRA